MPDDNKPEAPPNKPRRVVQIASASELSPIIALCDDSSIWYYTKTTDNWTRVSDVPDATVPSARYSGVK